MKNNFYLIVLYRLFDFMEEIWKIFCFGVKWDALVKLEIEQIQPKKIFLKSSLKVAKSGKKFHKGTGKNINRITSANSKIEENTDCYELGVLNNSLA